MSKANALPLSNLFHLLYHYFQESGIKHRMLRIPYDPTVNFNLHIYFTLLIERILTLGKSSKCVTQNPRENRSWDQSMVLSVMSSQLGPGTQASSASISYLLNGGRNIDL